MVTRYRAWLDGQGLQDIDPCIIVSDIQELGAVMDVKTAMRAHGDGMRVLRSTRRSLTVALRFYIEEYDTMRRKSVLQKVVSWAARGGRLTINDRPDQYLDVEADTLPVITSAQQWLGEITMTFIARDVPYWQEEWPDSVGASGTSGTARLFVVGDKEVPLEAVITNASNATLNTLSIALNGGEIRFFGLSVAPNDKVVMRMAGGLLELPVGCRTAESDDVLTVMPGESNVITWQADQKVQVTFSARGAWM